jgi:hypothetical protein
MSITYSFGVVKGREGDFGEILKFDSNSLWDANFKND